jgi:hypothetical protein
MELLKIGKRTYAVGLDAWLSVESHTKATKVAREKAKSLKFAIFALRPSPVPQIGLLKDVPKGALKGKVYSLAAAVAGAQPESWSGLFALPSGKWWVLSIFNGVIISNGDLITDESTARAQFDKELARLPGDIQPVEIADPQKALQWLAKNAADKYPAVLRKTQDSSLLLAGGALLGVCVIGGGLWWHHEQVVAAQQKVDHLALLRMLAAEKKHQAQSAPKVPPVVLPWAGKPAYTAWAMAVKTVVAPLSLANRGWLLSGVSCGTAECSATWQRNPGATVLDAPSGNAASPGIASPGIVAASGDAVTTVYPLGLSDARHVAAPVVGTARRLQGWMQGLGVSGSIQTQSPADGMAAGYPLQRVGTRGGQKAAFAPTWTAKTFQMALPVPPWQVNALDLLGLVMDSVTWRPGGDWHFTGVVYGPAH